MTPSSLPNTAKSPNSLQPKDIFERLDQLGITYKIYHHDPVFTVEEGLHLHKIIPGGHCKNLFLKNKKGQQYLVSAIENTKIDLKWLTHYLNAGRLSFGSAERLWESLCVAPGSVTPFALLNTQSKNTQALLDKHLFDFDVINFHPLVNTQSVTLSPQDLVRYIKSCQHEPQTIDFSGLSYT